LNLTEFVIILIRAYLQTHHSAWSVTSRSVVSSLIRQRIIRLLRDIVSTRRTLEGSNSSAGPVIWWI